MSFKSNHRFEYRQEQANKVLEKYPERIPVICEKLPSCKNVPDVDRYKYLVPGDIIATGTPSGVGFARTPPEFLKGGDIVECEIENIGKIINKVVDYSYQ